MTKIQLSKILQRNLKLKLTDSMVLNNCFDEIIDMDAEFLKQNSDLVNILNELEDSRMFYIKSMEQLTNAFQQKCKSLLVRFKKAL
jgi:hypothetical protein